MSSITTDPDYAQNPASVYYLHSTNLANAKLVFILFNGTRFCDWKHSMMISLSAKNKVAFVDGFLLTPTSVEDEQKAWDRYNNMVIGWTIASLERMTAKSIMCYRNNSEIWCNLEERFGKTNSTQLYFIKELFNATLGSGMNIAQFYSKMNALWDEIYNVSPPQAYICEK